MITRNWKLLLLLVCVTGYLSWQAVFRQHPTNPNRLDSKFVRSSQHYDAQVQAEMDAIWIRIEEFIEAKKPGFLAELPPPHSDEEIAEFEHKVGFRLPGDLRASFKRHGEWVQFFSHYSLRPMKANEEIWLEYMGYVFEEVGTARLGGEWQPGMIPFASWNGNELCVNLETGEVVNFGIDWLSVDVEAPSFRVWLQNVADRLEAGEFRLNGRTWNGNPHYDLLNRGSPKSIKTPGSVRRTPK